MAYAHSSWGSNARSSASCASALVESWDPAIRRIAYRHAKRFNRVDDAPDFAQEARIKLFQKAATHGAAPEQYIRKIISNAILAACLRTSSADIVEPLGYEAGQLPATIVEDDHLLSNVVGEWVRILNPRLKSVYELIYVKGYTQTEASQVLGVTQPRIAQLHLQMLMHARNHFTSIPPVK